MIKGSKTCNMSFFKADFDKLDGFNENFIGWGREDSEFVARFLFNKGIFRRLKFKAIAYHIYHKENSKKMLENNHQIYLDTIKNKKISW
ncbi:glycosyl transferase family 2, partial [Campylobacter jejuni]|nr:glycosyl transferase family 2 [Campylobacter jejuni]ECQ6898138.1 glycosyl transferase family 2 [Campylobacter jejuni]